jgi:hypothetical protein
MEIADLVADSEKVAAHFRCSGTHDSIERFIVRHYRYDPERRERRHVVVAAFDNEPEFRACMAGVQAEIRRRREAGEPVDPGEHVSGIVHEPGICAGRRTGIW